jgi:hypothetical protein
MEGAMAADRPPFGNSREHLNAELARLDLLIQREIWRWRQTGSLQTQSGPQPAAQSAPLSGVAVGDEFRGLYVSESEVDGILQGVYPGSTQIVRRVAGQRTEVAFQEAIDRAVSDIEERKAASIKRGISLRLERLRSLFALSPLDVSVLLVGLAPEVELAYERLYAYLQDDVTRKRPGVALMLNLLCATPDERVDARGRFAIDAPLLRHQLISLFADPAQPHPPLLAQCIRPDPRIVEWLLSQDDRDPVALTDTRLSDACEVSLPDIKASMLHLPSDVQAELDHLALLPDCRAPLAPPIILMMGDANTSKLGAAQAVCTAWPKPLLTVHLSRLLSRGDSFGQIARLAAREAYLVGAALYWHDYDLLMGSKENDGLATALQRESLHAAVLEYPVPSFLPVEDLERQPDPALLRAPRLVRVVLPRPTYPLRRALWEHRLQSYATAPGLDVESVAGRFRLADEQIQDAMLDARHRVAQRSTDQQVITTADLFAAARARTSDQLIHLAKKIEPRHAWNDLVLPDDQITQLHELCDQMRYRPLVLGEWGFDRKLSLGKGLNVLFAGPSGTGKTMAAEVVAGDLGLDLYKIDLSTVVSKYIGETEKNLERIFGAARNSNTILFFDEADALFGKRSEVRDAHDRYANVEISYLLQKMEEYDGLVVLTSNLNKNMDEAFVRRMHFTIEFPYPDEDARRRIWQIAFPAEAPLLPDVDFCLLAERYRLTGGNIRNIALTAAFLAARDGGRIGMDHLLWATRREFQKMGRLADEREFEVE